MRRVSLTGDDLTDDDDRPDGFRRRAARIGRRLGAERTGASLYELLPGQAVCPYHYEHSEEEWVLALEGRPSVRTPEGVTELAPLDLVFFPIGPEGAHQVLNTSDAPARFLMWSSIAWPAVTVYPDSDKVGVYVRDGADDLVVRRSSDIDYFADETGPAPPTPDATAG